MDVKLTIYSDDKQYFSQAISLPCVIGRARQCGVAIVHPVVSRRHCEIYEENGQVYVRDLGSLNGTVFQGVRIGRGVQIPYGSVFSIGRLFFLIEAVEDPTLMSEAVAQSSEISKSSDELREEMNRRVAVTLEQLANDSEKNDGLDPFAIDESEIDVDDSGPFDLDDLASEEF